MKLYRKLLSALIAVMLILGLFSALPAFAEDKPQVAVTVTIDKQSVPGGGDVTLSFAFDQRVEDVSSFSFYVEYDASLFTYDTSKSKMPDDYYANCNQNPYTIAYTETTPQTNLAKFGFGHISTVAAAFDGKDDYAEGVFYQMVFTAKSDITTDMSATFKLNSNGTQMLTYSFKEDGSLESITNEVDLTINRVSAGEGGEANTKSVTVTGPAWDDTTADISWYTNGTDPYIIRTAAELAGLASIVNGTAKDDAGNAIKDDFSGKTVTLANDIDLLNWNWTPIGRRTSGSLTFDSFAGTFNGDSHTITNLSITYDIAEHITPDGGFSGCVGLFGKVTGTEAARAEVKDLTLEGKVTITASDPSFSGGVQSFGGLAGRADYADFSNCIVNVDIKEDISNISEEVVEGLGGVVGSAKFIEIESCANLGKIEAIRISKVGGIAGEISDGNVVIKDCCNRGDVSAEEKGTAGGIVGDITFKKNTESFISNCYNTGTITTGTPSYPPGALFGKITKKNKKTSIVNVNNLYFLESSCTKGQGAGDNLETISKTAEEMQAGCFVDLLNSNNAWKQGSTYPILTCQAYEEPGPAHALQHVEAKEATCAEEGNQEYWKCSVCEKLFSDAEGTMETTAEEVVIQKLAHTLEKTEAKPASCTEAGNIDYWTCSACEKLFLDAEGKTETTAEAVVIAKLDHKLEKTEAKAATCTEAGNIDYWTCSVCQRLFSDEAGTTEINQEGTVIPAPGHAWGDWKTITPATDASEGEEERECSRCHMKETQSIPPLTHIHGLEHINAVPANCTEPGNIEYWQCNTSAEDGMTPCHRYFKDETGTTEIDAEETVVKALGHDFGEWSLKTPATCKTPGVETRVCSRDAVEETRETGIDPNAHEYDEGVVTTEPTCTRKGVMTYTCFYDNTHTRTEDIDALDHDYQAVEESAQEPTCTKAGKKADQKCSRCGDVITGEEIPAKGHTWSDWELTTPATCTEAGQELRTCSACDEEETREVDALGHDLQWVVDEAPDGETAGTRHQECSRCDYRTEPEEYFVMTLIVDGKETTVDVPAGSDFILPEGPEKEGFKFLYWEGSKYYPGDKYKADAPHTFKAVYEKIEEPTEGGSENTAPKTGDTNNTSTWIIIMAVAFALLVGGGIFAIRKKVK